MSAFRPLGGSARAYARAVSSSEGPATTRSAWRLLGAGEAAGGAFRETPGLESVGRAVAPAGRRAYRLPGHDGETFAQALALASPRARLASPPRRDAGPSIHGINQMDPAEYDSASQARLWGGSTCSAASLTAVLRAQGQSVRIADVLREMGGGITVAQGLVSRPALVRTAERFGLQARDEAMTYDALVAATASGQPVLVDITNGRFPEGHWIVVTGGDAAGLRIADSSGYRLTNLTRDEFMRAWSGRGVRILNSDPPLAGRPVVRGG